MTPGRPDPSDLWFQAGGGTPDYDDARYRGFPDSADVNWGLLKELYDKPHPLIRVGDTDGLHYGIVELLYEAQAVHHLLDLIGVPPGYSLDTRAIDDRVLIAIRGYLALHERLVRVSAWHARETGPAGTVGDFCTECGHRWPCDTRRMADGTYIDEDCEDCEASEDARAVEIRRRDPAEAAERIRAGYREHGIPADIAEAMIEETLKP